MSQKLCPSCSNMVDSSTSMCPFCFYEFPGIPAKKESTANPKADAKPESTKENSEKKEATSSTTNVNNTYKAPEKATETAATTTPPKTSTTSATTPPPKTTTTSTTTPPPKTTTPPPKTTTPPPKTNVNTGISSTKDGMAKPQKKGGFGKLLLRLFIIGLLICGFIKVKDSYASKKAAQLAYEQQQAAEAERLAKEEEERLAAEEEAERLAAEEAAKNPYAHIPYAEQYIFPDSFERYIAEEEVADLEFETIRIAINEIYARHGYVFQKAQDMNEYFSSCDWYTPDSSCTDQAAVANNFNEYEKANILVLSKYRDLKKK